MELKGRLKLIAVKVPECNTVCDIGTDHAYIPIYLMEKGICKKAIASDSKAGPLKIAAKNIEEHGFAGTIETRLCDGLDGIGPDEADVIVIAGMGGLLISEILGKGIEKARKAGLLILQPMNSAEVLRKWLYENGFDILNEELAAENDKLYNVITAKWDGKAHNYGILELHIGKRLVENADPLLIKLVRKLLGKTEKMMYGMKNSGRMDENEWGKLIKLRSELKDLEKKIESK